jgi:hypothetical protein
MSFPDSKAKTLLRTLTIFGPLLASVLDWSPVALAAPASPSEGARESGSEKVGKGAGGETEGLGKRERKALKREKQREAMLKRIERGVASRKPAPPPAPATIPKPYQFAEDFDSSVSWEERDSRASEPNAGFGYSSANHLAAAGCAPGEIGGSVSDNAVSWFADNVAGGSVLLDLDAPLRASGWCTFTAMLGNANVGWFNSDTYAAPDVAPHAFIGWRQEGVTIRAALGHTGLSLVNGPPLVLSNSKPFAWTLSYHPTGGVNACGDITLTIDGASSALSLTKEQKDALAANKFNCFGIVTAQTGSQTSTLWLDNLTYTRISSFPVPHAAAVAHTRTAFFDTDPTGSTFFAVNNLSPHEPVTVIQDYGYQSTGGRTGGCVGGRLTPAIGLSYYGYDYGAKMLHFSDKLRSEGWIQVPDYEGRCFHLGWTSKHGMSWHEPSTLAMRISSIGIKGQGRCINVAGEGTLKDYEGHGGAGWGTITTFQAGPEWHHYVMELDPAGARGLGTFTVEFDGTAKVFYFGEEKIQKGGDTEIFGMWNAKLPAEEKVMTAYLDDVTNTTNGQRDPASNDFNSTPSGWVGVNNNFTARDYIVRPYHQFGWAKTLSHLDGLNGYSPMYAIPESDRYCMGGIIYLASFDNLNVPRASYGAGLNGTLNARDHHMVVTGRFKIDWANVDAGELVGWYNSATACDQVTGGKGHGLPDKFLGVSIAAGSNGYGMIPCYRSPLEPEEQTLKFWNPAARVYEDGEWREFYMEYDPDGAAGRGQLKLQLGKDGSQVTYDLDEGAKGSDFSFDRFGLLTHRKGGGKPHAIYFDKLTYTVAP